MKVLDHDVGGIGFEGNTVCGPVSVQFTRKPSRESRTITVVDNRVLDDNFRRAVNIPIHQILVSPTPPPLSKYHLPSISILSRILALTIPRDINPLKQNIRGIGHKVIPLRRVSQFQRTNGTPMQTNDTHQNRAQNEGILGIQVIPDLSVPIERTVSVNVDILATELEEGCCVLVDLFEGVGLPVVCVVGELDCAQDLCDRNVND